MVRFDSDESLLTRVLEICKNVVPESYIRTLLVTTDTMGVIVKKFAA